MPTAPKQYHLRPRARTAPEGAGAWPGATYPDCTVSPSLADAATLKDFEVPVDPRTWLEAPPSWTPSQLAVNLALAGMWILGARDCSARWFAIRCAVPQRELKAALATAARGPGHPMARLEGNKVVLERADLGLRAPAAFWRFDVHMLARARSAQGARAWLLYAQAAASKRREFTLHLTTVEIRKALALRDKMDPMPVLRLAAAALGDAEVAAFNGHRLLTAETPDGVVIAAPRTAFRTRWMPPHVLGRFGVYDGKVGHLDVGVGRTESLRAWLGALEEKGLKGHFGAAKGLWLAVVSAADEGIESPVPGYSTTQLRAALARVGATKAFDGFVDHLVKLAGAQPGAPAPLPWMVSGKDSKALAAARLARAKGEPRVDVGPVVLVPYVAPTRHLTTVDDTYIARAIRDRLEWRNASAYPEATAFIRRVLELLWQPIKAEDDTPNGDIARLQATARRDFYDDYALRDTISWVWQIHEDELLPLSDAWNSAEGGITRRNKNQTVWVWDILGDVASIWSEAVYQATSRAPGRGRALGFSLGATSADDEPKRKPTTAKVRAERRAEVERLRAKAAARVAAEEAAAQVERVRRDAEARSRAEAAEQAAAAPVLQCDPDGPEDREIPW